MAVVRRRTPLLLLPDRRTGDESVNKSCEWAGDCSCGCSCCGEAAPQAGSRSVAPANSRGGWSGEGDYRTSDAR